MNILDAIINAQDGAASPSGSVRISASVRTRPRRRLSARGAGTRKPACSEIVQGEVVSEV